MAQGLVKTSTSLSTSSECLTRCKWDNYELAMIVEGKNKTFNCTCIQRDFYKFTMQDFSSYCTDVSTYNLHTLISNYFIMSSLLKLALYYKAFVENLNIQLIKSHKSCPLVVLKMIIFLVFQSHARQG